MLLRKRSSKPTPSHNQLLKYDIEIHEHIYLYAYSWTDNDIVKNSLIIPSMDLMDVWIITVNNYMHLPDAGFDGQSW